MKNDRLNQINSIQFNWGVWAWTLQHNMELPKRLVTPLGEAIGRVCDENCLSFARQGFHWIYVFEPGGTASKWGVKTRLGECAGPKKFQAEAEAIRDDAGVECSLCLLRSSTVAICRPNVILCAFALSWCDPVWLQLANRSLEMFLYL